MSSSRRKRPGKLAAVALLLGFVAILAIPAAGALAAYREDVKLLEAEIVAVPAALVLGLIAVSLSRRARGRVERSVRRRGAGLVRAARLAAWSGVYFAVTGGLALAFYGVLKASS